MAIPRWMATAAHRDALGDALGVITGKLGGAQAGVEVVPAIDMARRKDHRFSPYGCGAPVLKLTSADERALSRHPGPLQVMVPVTMTASRTER